MVQPFLSPIKLYRTVIYDDIVLQFCAILDFSILRDQNGQQANGDEMFRLAKYSTKGLQERNTPGYLF